jgi:hypothetical protein
MTVTAYYDSRAPSRRAQARRGSESYCRSGPGGDDSR